MSALEGKKFAFLVADGYEDLECWYPKIRLEEEGAETTVGSYKQGTYESKHGLPIEATHAAQEMDVADFDGLIIPGGTGSPDRLRRFKAVTNFVRSFDEQGKLIAAICHAGWVPISAGILEGRTMTSYKAIKDDMINAGVNYKDQPVVVDENIVSSRHPGDLPQFCKAIIKHFS
ncbi:MAG: type 1 glutamine amidotransferase domain-containing protein [Candidatus Bipolaricaulota bacterium]